jgi:Ca2+-dependent lipid-binding protein
MPLILGEFLVMSGSFFVIFLILITCINVQAKDSERTDRAIRRRYQQREMERKKRLNRYR